MSNLKPEKIGTVTLYVGRWEPVATGIDARTVRGETMLGDDFMPCRETFRVIHRRMRGRTTEYAVIDPATGKPENAFSTVGAAMKWIAERWRAE